MKPTTPYAIGVAAAATWGFGPLVTGAITACIVGAWVLVKIAVRVLAYPGPTVIDPDSPPYKVDKPF